MEKEEGVKCRLAGSSSSASTSLSLFLQVRCQEQYKESEVMFSKNDLGLRPMEKSGTFYVNILLHLLYCNSLRVKILNIIF